MHDATSESSTASAPRRQRRADAERNHAKVIAAAHAEFLAHGLQATMSQIAERSGVSKATIYRTYPTKAALVSAIVQSEIDALTRRTEAVRIEDDPDGALRAYISELFTQLHDDRLLIEVIGHVEDFTPTALFEAMAHLLRTAQGTGAVRADATVTDLRVLVCGMALQLDRMGHNALEDWTRCAELAMAALRP